MKFYRPGQRAAIKRIGGKAFNLSWLHKKGYPVPPAVFLPTAMMRRYLRFNGLQAASERLASQALYLDGQQLSRQLNELRSKIEQGKYPPEIVKTLEMILRNFSGTVAVRSSAVDEDSALRSFAGQYATILNVAARPHELAQALRRVWASAWSEQVVRYRLKNNVSLNSGLGVIIQQMLQPQLAGVAFSVQPDDPEERYSLIEFVHGLGEQLVDGSQTPQRLSYDRLNDRWENRQNMPAEYAPAFERLAEYILRLERQKGGPVDVEWAMENPQKLYLLQMRAVTATVQGNLWTRENVGEVIPDVVTPFSWSVLKPLVNQAYEYFLKRVGVDDYPPEGLFALYQGRVYFNHSAFRRIMNHFYLSRDSGHSKIIKLLAIAGKMIRSMYFLSVLPRKIKKYLKNHSHRLASIAAADATDMQRILKEMDGLIQIQRQTMALHISGTIAGELYYQLLDKLGRSWLRGEEGAADELLSRSATVVSSQSAKLLAEIAERIRPDRQLKEQVLRLDWPQARESLAHTAQGARILAAFNDFLTRYGYGALHEFELYYPRWREEPDYIWRNLQNYLRSERPAASQKQLEERPSKKWADMGLIKKIVLNHVFARAKFYSVYREELKQAFLKAHDRLKMFLMALAEKLIRQGKIKEPLEVLFFSRQELDNFVLKGAPYDLPEERLRQRKEQRRRFERQPYPSKLRQVGEQWIPLAEETENAAAGLQGLPCSAGLVRGSVKIVLRPEQFSDLAKGQILVAPAVNPGWAPLIMSAAAVVTEIGGALSHGAIIAREFGIPMVASVAGVTQRLQDGQFIEVNGSTGKIKILEDGENGFG